MMDRYWRRPANPVGPVLRCAVSAEDSVFRTHQRRGERAVLGDCEDCDGVLCWTAPCDLRRRGRADVGLQDGCAWCSGVVF